MANNSRVNYNCPALMSDARHGTDYRPRNDSHTAMIDYNKLKSSHDTRLFLQTNAKDLMRLNHEYFIKQKGCPSAKWIHPDPMGFDEYWREYKNRINMEQTNM